MTVPACMEASVRKDGIATFVTVRKQAFQGPHVEMVSRNYVCMSQQRGQFLLLTRSLLITFFLSFIPLKLEKKEFQNNTWDFLLIAFPKAFPISNQFDANPLKLTSFPWQNHTTFAYYSRLHFEVHWHGIHVLEVHGIGNDRGR